MVFVNLNDNKYYQLNIFYDTNLAVNILNIISDI